MTSSPWAAPAPAPEDAAALLDLAEAGIQAGLAGEPAPRPALDDLPPALQRRGGVFVTLTVDGDLNGCIGSIEGTEALGVAVPRLAWSAAFADYRLPDLRADQYGRLHISISLLSALEPLAAGSLEELVAGLRPGVDGLVIGTPAPRAVFLPAVWEQLPDPGDFVAALYQKGGLRVGSWAPGMAAWRFTVTSIERDPG